MPKPNKPGKVRGVATGRVHRRAPHVAWEGEDWVRLDLRSASKRKIHIYVEATDPDLAATTVGDTLTVKRS